MPSTVLTPNVRDQIARLGSADIMVGIPSFKNAATIGYVVRAAQAGLVQYFPDLRPVVVNSDAGSPDGTGRVVVETEPPDYVEEILLVRPNQKLERVSLTYPEIDGVGGKGAALRTIFEIAAALEVQALVVVDSDLRSIVPEWIELLSGPILKGGYDYVSPLYARYKYDGTITNAIAYPLTRALYGARIRQPIGGEFAISGDLVQRYLELDTFDELTARFGIDVWMTHSAINEGLAVCQTRLGAKIHDAKDPAGDLGPMFRQVVGTLFGLAGRYEDRWMKVRGSHSIPEYGFERVIAPELVEVNHAKLVDNFETARLSQVDAWEQILSPDQLARVMSIEIPSQPTAFHFPADLWIRCLYDALVAYNRPGIDRERLLASLTPLYFGRTAAFIAETIEMTTDRRSG